MTASERKAELGQGLNQQARSSVTGQKREFVGFKSRVDTEHTLALYSDPVIFDF